MPTYSICPSCNTGYDLADELRGKRVICQTCNDAFLVQETLRAPAAVAVPVAGPSSAPPPPPTQGYNPAPFDYPEVLPVPSAAPHEQAHSEWDRLPRRRQGRRPPQESGMSTGAIVAMVLVPVAVLVVLAVVLVLALQPRNNTWRGNQGPVVRPGVAPIFIPPARFNNPQPQWQPPRVIPPRVVNPPRFNPPRVRFR